MSAHPHRSSSADPVSRLRRAVARHLDRAPAPLREVALVVAVSGGPDSTALLDALADAAPARGLTLVVAHLHHGLRGVEADADAAFVAGLARDRGIQLESGRADVAALARAERRPVEEAGRLARRRFLLEAARRHGATAVALGHTRDDQAETLFMNLLRGAGPRGLGGMPRRGPGPFIRPLLDLGRADVVAYLAALGLSSREDSSNRDTRLNRNRVRHELLPLLRERFNPRIARVLSRQADLFAEIDALLRREARGFLAAESGPCGETGLWIRIAPLRACPRALRRAVLREAAGKVSGGLSGWGRRHLDDLLVLAATPGSGRLDLPGGVTARRTGERLELRPRLDPAPPAGAPASPLPLSTLSGAETPFGPFRLRVGHIEAPGPGGLCPPDGRRAAWFDAATLPDALFVRAALAGDRVSPFGGGGSRKLSDVLIDGRIPREHRGSFPLVTGFRDGREEILWVAGLVRSDAAPLTGATRRILTLDLFGVVM